MESFWCGHCVLFKCDCFDDDLLSLTLNPDQLWGIIARRVGKESGILDPDDVISAISSELTKPSIRDWVGNQTRISVKKLDCTRPWRSHLPSTGVKLEGGLLRDGSGNHLFLSMQRRGDGFGQTHVSSSAN